MFPEEIPDESTRNSLPQHEARLADAVQLYFENDFVSSQEILDEFLNDVSDKKAPVTGWLSQVILLASRNLLSLRNVGRLEHWVGFFQARGLDPARVPEFLLLTIKRDFLRGDGEAALKMIDRYLDENAQTLTAHVPEFFMLRSRIYEMQGEIEKALEDREIAYYLALYLGLARSTLTYSGWLGILNNRLSRYSDSLKWFGRAVQHGKNFPKRLINTYINIAVNNYKFGRFEAALEALEKFQILNQAGPHKKFFRQYLLAMSRVNCLLRQFSKARKHLQTLDKLFQDPGNYPRERALAREFMADINLAKGEVDVALGLYRKSMDLAEKIPSEAELGMTLHRRIGECIYLQGDMAGGLSELNKALEITRTRKDIFEEGVTLRTLAEAHLASGDLPASRSTIDQAVVILGEIEARHEQAIALLRSAELALVELDRQESTNPPLIQVNRAWGQATHALDLFLKVGVDWWTEQTRELLQRIALLKDEHEKSGGQESAAIKKPAAIRYRTDQIIIHGSGKMRDLLQLCDLYAGTNEPVLITGETGTGKELLARRLHDNSDRNQKKLVTVNVAAIPESLFEREFFGHVSGAFTGAEQDCQGYAGEANGGILFLDEIGDLPMEAQPKLLRLLQEGTYQALGDPSERRTDIRLVAATNADLGQLVRENKFRSDLYYRLKILELNLPPLRARPDDIFPLLRHFLSIATGRPTAPAEVFSAGSLSLLRQYFWPGNVRELAMVARKAQIQLEATGRVEIKLDAGDEQTVVLTGRQLQPLAAEVAEGGSDQERLRVELALAESCGNRQEAARLLGISRSTLYRKLKALGISAKTG